MWRNITRRARYSELHLQLVQIGFARDGCQDAQRLMKDLLTLRI